MNLDFGVTLLMYITRSNKITIGQQRMAKLSLLTIENNLINSIDYEDVIDKIR
jgi:hypothetical protein